MARPCGIDHPAALRGDALLAQCSCRSGRSSGPGGQHRNKVETACFLEHTPTGTRAQATERRSLAENRSVALHRLRLALAVAVRTHAATGTAPLARPPSQLWASRAAGGRIRCAAEHEDFPQLMAEALDAWAAAAGDARTAAESLRVTPSQLIRFTARLGTAWASVAALRARHGLPPLRP